MLRKIKKTDDLKENIEFIEDRPFNDKRYWITDNKIKELGWEIKRIFDTEIDILISL